MLPMLRALPYAKRYEMLNPKGNDEKGVGLVQYSLPLLDIHRNEIVLFPLNVQSVLLKISKNLDLFNQRVSFLQGRLDRTFDQSISEENHRRLVENDLKQGYRDLADRAEMIVDLVSKVPPKRAPWLSRKG